MVSLFNYLNLNYINLYFFLSEETNTRVVFERLLNSENALAPENSGLVQKIFRKK